MAHDDDRTTTQWNDPLADLAPADEYAFRVLAEEIRRQDQLKAPRTQPARAQLHLVKKKTA